MVRGTTRNIQTAPAIKLPSFEASIHNRFDIEVIDAKTGVVKQRARGFNTICDSLWTRLCSSNTYFNYIHYGTGSGTPSAADTSLFSYLGGAQPSGYNQNIDLVNGVAYVRRSIQLTASTAVGETLTEVGIAYGSGSATLCTHAMLEDMNGNSVSITKTDTDVVNIYATIYIHFNSKGYGGGAIRLFRNNGGSGGNIFLFLSGVNGTPSSNFWARADNQLDGGATYCYPTSAETVYTLGATFSYDATNKKVVCTIPRMEASAFNMGGIRRMYMGYYGESISNTYIGSYMQFDIGGDWYPCTEIISEAVGTGDGSTVDFALDFPYAHDAKVYIDGVETTDFTLDYGPHTSDARYSVDYLDANATADNHIPAECASTSYFTGSRIFYNPAYAIGLATVYIGANVTLYASNDCKTWEQVTAATTSARTFTIPDEFAHYKYWKGANSSSKTSPCYANAFISTYTNKKLHFNTPPASGAVITADYKTDTIAKDVNHVFDMSFEIQLGEYVEG